MSDRSALPEVDLGALGLDRGGHLLIKRALRSVAVGSALKVRGSAPELALHLATWCRAKGHVCESSGPASVHLVTRGSREDGRWRGAERAGWSDASHEGAVLTHPPAHWGLSPRGAWVEAGGKPFGFVLDDKDEVWTDEVGRLYLQAAAAQWDPATAVDWSAKVELASEVEDAVVQVMTYLIENETAALIVPSRFLAQVHPHFREVMQFLAIQAADEARHVELFTRRARLVRSELGLTTVGGQESLRTLIEEPDFALASFLLSVLGEGSFLSLLRFLHAHGPDIVTREVARLAAQDEARHVAFGIAHLSRHVERDPALLGRLASAAERRHEALKHSAGLNEEVFDALVLMAAGDWSPEALERGFERVQELERDMDQGRRSRLMRIGFTQSEAERISSLHTRNFM